MPEPVLVSIAVAAAGRAIAGLYQLVRNRFADDPAATAALDAAEGAAEDSREVEDLSVALERAETADPAFAEELRALWRQGGDTAHAESGGVVNQTSGTVHGNLVQARDIGGGIHF